MPYSCFHALESEEKEKRNRRQEAARSLRSATVPTRLQHAYLPAGVDAFQNIDRATIYMFTSI